MNFGLTLSGTFTQEMNAELENKDKLVRYQRIVCLMDKIKASQLSFIVTLGIINKVVELCDVFFNGSHTNCCFGAMEFSDDALHLTKQLTEGRKLVGKIDPQQSAETKRGKVNK